MQLIKGYVLVVLNLVGELWTGFYSRNPDFYDKYSATQTKIGYIFFVTMVTLATVGIASWLYIRIY
ncbi:hypothetical protein [Paenibacillus antarcticus]|uniref:Uncharacterized protein n=1 Tax=Paenibacillus antarcticus TaxID=253703 RepID=A0A162KDE5_9BACL|nr:hypothetical protein [Paenibacillus antarcticus]OAB44988.1 hypothetical protein PBAT_13635 [Paenibacillus antarcticus]